MVLHIRSLGVCAPQGPTIYWATIAMGTALSLIWLMLGELLRLQFNTLLGVFSILIGQHSMIEGNEGDNGHEGDEGNEGSKGNEGHEAKRGMRVLREMRARGMRGNEGSKGNEENEGNEE